MKMGPMTNGSEAVSPEPKVPSEARKKVPITANQMIGKIRL